MRHAPTIMIGGLGRSLRVEAQLCGSGPRPWAWAIYGVNAGLALERSEPMFSSPEAARRIGALVAAQIEVRADARRPRLH
ncbi:hypothetical protein [Methylobacterium sp. J-070]|uniref:hypothetical protein n=1 Tax=Methylobacterium sp. J-070 TaxID=2836650 RepID=UPI001FBBAC85|nr:hypothetical protein [Methylobacterium sp. J-070]MCJ2050191.1 hypothetical protein [Methylobacterium sp. J-070]